MKKKFIIMLAMIGFFAVQARHARMIIEFDVENYEKDTEYLLLSKKPVVMDTVFALYEKTAPILMSSNLWYQILFYYKQFKEKLQDSNSQEYLYHQIYLKIGECANELLPLLTASTEQEKKAELAQKVQQKMNNDELYKKCYEKRVELASTVAYNHDLYVIMHDFFKLEEWDIYRWGMRFVLCMPRAYKDEKIRAFKQECSLLNLSPEKIVEQMPRFSIEEIALGLQTNYNYFVPMEETQFEDFSMLQETMSEHDRHAIQKTRYFVDDFFSNLFVTRYDVSEALKAHIDFILPTWNFTLSGHGEYVDLSPELEKMLARSEQMHTDIGFIVGKGKREIFDEGLQKKRAQNEKTSFMTKFRRKKPRKKSEKNDLILSLQKKPDQNKKMSIEKFNKEADQARQKSIEQLKELDKTINTMLAETEGTVVSLSLPTFSSLLDFFDKHIKTSMLFYSTCFSGGRNVQLSFTSGGIHKIYNFTLISAISSDVTAMGAMPLFVVHDFEADDFVIAAKGVRLDYVNDASYQKFFDFQEHNDRLEKVIRAIVPIATANAPAIRLPGMTWFSTMQLGEFATLNKIAISKAVQKGSLAIADVLAILFYIPYIPLDLVLTISPSFVKESEESFIYNPDLKFELEYCKKELFDANKTPLFVSMMPGNATHWIKKISAPDRLFTSFVDNMLSANIAGEKIYLIDELNMINNIDNRFTKPADTPSPHKLIDIPSDVLTTFEKVTFFSNLEYDPLYPEDVIHNFSGMFFTVKDKGYMGIYTLMLNYDEMNQQEEGATAQEPAIGEGETTEQEKYVFQEGDEEDGEELVAGEEEPVIEAEEPAIGESEMTEQEESAVQKGEEEEEDIEWITQIKLSPTSRVEEMEADEFERYKTWYEEQKTKAHKSADLLTNVSKIEDFLSKRSLAEKARVEQKEVRKRRAKK